MKEDFEIKGVDNILKAILKLTFETRVAISAQNTFLVENINNGKTHEENITDFRLIGDQVHTKIYEDLFLQLGDLNLRDLLGDK